MLMIYDLSRRKTTRAVTENIIPKNTKALTGNLLLYIVLIWFLASARAIPIVNVAFDKCDIIRVFIINVYLEVSDVPTTPKFGIAKVIATIPQTRHIKANSL